MDYNANDYHLQFCYECFLAERRLVVSSYDCNQEYENE
jgi:hypothetical protein